MPLRDIENRAGVVYDPLKKNRIFAEDLQGLDTRITDLEDAPPGSSAWGGITGILSDQTDLQAELDAKQDDLGFTPEDVANKQTDLTASATKYPTVNAVNTGLATKENSLGFTAENVANKDTDSAMTANSDTKYPSQKAVKTALATKEPSLGFTAVPNTRTVNGHALSADVTVTKSDVGLSNVDNTTDAGKPVSTAQQTALDFKQNIDADLTAIAGLDSATAGAIASDGAGWIKKTYAQFKTALGLVKADVGLSNVDNTTDAGKPVSTAQQTALDLKQNSLGFTAENSANKENTTIDTNTTKYPTVNLLKTGLDTKQASLGFTAENVANKDTDSTFAANSDTKYPSQKAVKTAVDGKQASLGYTPVNKAGDTMTGAFKEAVSVLTDGATPALDASLGNVFTLAAAGDRTIGIPSNATAGQKIVIRHLASGGARTLALNSGAGGFRFGSDITALSQTVSGKYDYIACIYNSTDSKWDVVGYIKGF